jgi:hypothetical protein
MQETNFSFEQQLGSRLVLSATFIYTKGDRLPVTFDANLPAPTLTRTFTLPGGSTMTLPFDAGITKTAAGVTQSINLSRPNPKFGSINQQASIGETFYKAFVIEARRRFAHGFQFNVSYTLAKAENTSGTGDGGGTGSESPFGGASLFNQFDLGGDRAPAPTDQRHRFIVDGVYNLPQLKEGSTFARALLNGYRISGIYVAESGRPYAATIAIPTIPFLLNGAIYTGFGGGTLGMGGLSLAPDVPRNSTYGDWNYKIDLRIARDFSIGERLKVEVLGEAFNLFNRSNFNGFNGTLYDASFPINPATGLPYTTSSPPPASTPISLTPRSNFGQVNNDGSQPDGTNARRFQLALRFRF